MYPLIDIDSYEARRKDNLIHFFAVNISVPARMICHLEKKQAILVRFHFSGKDVLARIL